MAPGWVAGIAFLLGAAATAVGCWWRMRVVVRRAVLQATAAGLDSQRIELEQLHARLDDRDRELARADGRIGQLETQLSQQSDALAERSRALGDRQAAAAALEARLEEARRAFAEKEAWLRDSSTALKQEFEVLANRVFDRQGEAQQANLATVLTPLRDQLSDFRKRVETVYTAETRDRATLLSEVRNLQQASERINREAENLTRALKGDVKAQGNWGEMVLERVLETSGLRAGHEYFLQETRRDGEGSLKRPDVLIRLPDDKDVVVDAKLSLLAYEQALAAADDAGRDSALRQHVASVRTIRRSKASLNSFWSCSMASVNAPSMGTNSSTKSSEPMSGATRSRTAMPGRSPPGPERCTTSCAASSTTWRRWAASCSAPGAATRRLWPSSAAAKATCCARPNGSASSARR